MDGDKTAAVLGLGYISSLTKCSGPFAHTIHYVAKVSCFSTQRAVHVILEDCTWGQIAKPDSKIC